MLQVVYALVADQFAGTQQWAHAIRQKQSSRHSTSKPGNRTCTHTPTALTTKLCRQSSLMHALMHADCCGPRAWRFAGTSRAHAKQAQDCKRIRAQAPAMCELGWLHQHQLLLGHELLPVYGREHRP
jgi:hypothetical protein